MNEAALRRAVAELMANRKVVGRPGARQWRFFNACVEALLGGEVDPEMTALAPATAAQLKFEVEDRLRRHALRPGPALPFVFSLGHESTLAEFGIDDDTTKLWPAVAGYRLFVRDLGADYGASNVDLAGYLERVVAEAMDAEFRAYQRLPTVDVTGLDQWFVLDGPAWREIVTVLTRNAARGWHLRNPLNPSTTRLISVTVTRTGPTEAVVRTQEYVYLRWWSEPEQKYAYPYREFNRQTYTLVGDGTGSWRVFENLRPPPRQTAPHRRPKARTRRQEP